MTNIEPTGYSRAAARARYNSSAPMSPRLKVLTAAASVLVAATALAATRRHPRQLPAPSLAIPTDRLVADGYDSATLSIDAPASPAPRVAIAGPAHSALAADPVWTGDHWESEIRSGVNPGQIALRVSIPGRLGASLHLKLNPASADSAGDGTPDFLRLSDAANQRAFRRWFTWLAEAEYFQEPVNRPAEISDCAALIRFAYREALHVHDHAWSQSARLPLLPSFDSVTKYEYPFTPLGANLFRTVEGPYQGGDLSSGAFIQFADVKTIWRYNTHLVSRDVSRAEPGDLILYKQDSGAEPYHSMIYLGASQLQPDGGKYVVYHTGPTRTAHGDEPGEIRRLTVGELMRFPQAEWRPSPENPGFLGVYRWNILRKIQPFS